MKSKDITTSKQWQRIAAEAIRKADEDLYQQHLRGEFGEGDPNHPKYNNGYNYATGKYTLFGYDQDEFLARQYR